MYKCIKILTKSNFLHHFILDCLLFFFFDEVWPLLCEEYVKNTSSNIFLPILYLSAFFIIIYAKTSLLLLVPFFRLCRGRIWTLFCSSPRRRGYHRESLTCYSCSVTFCNSWSADVSSRWPYYPSGSPMNHYKNRSIDPARGVCVSSLFCWCAWRVGL